MKPMTSIAALSALTILLAACATSGSAGTVPPGGATPEPSVAQGSPDLTPEPSSLPSGSPAPSADPSASAPPSQTPPAGTTVVRAYFYFESVPGSSGLVPILREVPATKAVATAAMAALLEGPTETESGAMSSAIPCRHAAARAHDQGRGRDGRSLERVRVRRRQCVGHDPPRPGRLHADPVPDRQVGRVPDRRTHRHRLRQRGHRPRRSRRPGRLHRPPARHSLSTDRPTARRSATRPGSPARAGSLRGCIPRDPARWRRPDDRRSAGHGGLHVRERSVRYDRPVRRPEGAVGHASGLGGFGQGRQSDQRSRVSRLAHPGLRTLRRLRAGADTYATFGPRGLARAVVCQACLIVIRSMMLATSSAWSIVASSRP